MNIIVNRIYFNDIPEHDNILKRRKLYFEDILSIEESVFNINQSKLYLTGGEEIFIDESFDSITNRIETIKEDERTKDIIG